MLSEIPFKRKVGSLDPEELIFNVPFLNMPCSPDANVLL